MKIHELKILPQYFEEVLKGNKTFEIRKNDRDFKIRDILILKEWAEDIKFDMLTEGLRLASEFNKEEEIKRKERWTNLFLDLQNLQIYL